MPYIKQEKRDALAPCNTAFDAGELNYVITGEILRYLNQKGLSYTNINAVIGVLECAKLELYRRVAAPYENSKCEENGDVY